VLPGPSPRCSSSGAPKAAPASAFAVWALFGHARGWCAVAIFSGLRRRRADDLRGRARRGSRDPPGAHRLAAALDLARPQRLRPPRGARLVVVVRRHAHHGGRRGNTHGGRPALLSASPPSAVFRALRDRRRRFASRMVDRPNAPRRPVSQIRTRWADLMGDLGDRRRGVAPSPACSSGAGNRALLGLPRCSVLGWTNLRVALPAAARSCCWPASAVFALPRRSGHAGSCASLSIGLSVTLCAPRAVSSPSAARRSSARIKLFHAMRESTDSDLRVLIYRDAPAHDPTRRRGSGPWASGNFEPVFALHREISDAPMRVIHPESDWLWMAAGARPGSQPLLALLFIVPGLRNPPLPLGVARALADSPTRPRIAGARFFLPAWLSVDVSGHRMGSAMPGALSPGSSACGRSAAWPNETVAALVLSRGAAAGGDSRARGEPGFARAPRPLAEPGSGPPRPPRKKEAMALNTAGRYARGGAIEHLLASRHAPLDWEFYFIRASAELLSVAARSPR